MHAPPHAASRLCPSVPRPFAAFAATLAAVAAVGASACSDTPTAPTSTAAVAALPSFSTATWQGTNSSASVSSRLSPSQCVSALNGGTTPGTKVVVSTCTGGPEQQFVWNASGEIRNGALCVDASGGQGNNGDHVILYGCNGGQNQQWTGTTAGQIIGMNGRCLDIPGSSTVDGTQLIIWNCHGTQNESWDEHTITTAAPVPTPVVTATTGTRAQVLAFMAASNLASVSAIQAKGGAYAKYESDFVTYANRHWASDSTSFDANFYDRAMIYYVWWARTGNATYLDRANKLAIQARTDIESWNYYPMTYNLMLDGVALHALVTGDQRSAAAVAKVADNLANPHGWFSYVAGHVGDAEGDSRNSARILNGVLDAQLLQVNSPAGYSYAALLPDLETRILGTQSADGAYRWPNQCNFDKPFMTGMLNDALIRYYTSFQADPQIVSAVQKSVDYLWAHDWVPGDQGFRYIGSPNGCSNPSSGGTGGATDDLNNLISSGFAFVAKQTGDASYFTKADAVFSGGVYNAWITGTKQFNQEYTASYRYLALRF
ncbi:MAG TPA: ricin-type beta-trefoil lectin domain protein [Gemmatirosa sp.]